MMTQVQPRSYASDERLANYDTPGFMQLLLIDHDVLHSNLYTAYQKVKENGSYIRIRLVTHVHYNELMNEDRFHFDPLELQYALAYAEQRGDETLPCFAFPLSEL